MRAQARAWVLGKDARAGAVPAWSLAVFFPVHAANHLAYGARVLLEKHAGLKGGFEPASRHASGVWVGGLQAQEAAGAPTPFAGVVDLTNEFSERCAGVRGGPAYLNVPLWDGTAPTPAQIGASRASAPRGCARAATCSCTARTASGARRRSRRPCSSRRASRPTAALRRADQGATARLAEPPHARGARQDEERAKRR